jgi:hypothetical protein
MASARHVSLMCAGHRLSVVTCVENWPALSLTRHFCFFCARARFVTTGDLFLIIIILEFTHHYPRDERAAHQGLDSNTCLHICKCVRRDRRRFFSLWSFARELMVLKISAHSG